MNPLTPKQAKILEFIESFYAEHGSPPSFADIQQHFKFSSINAVTGHVKALHKKGHVHFTPGQSRSLVPVRTLKTNFAESHRLPLLGTIAAGQPLLAEEQVDEYVDLQSLGLENPTGKFALRVKGDSMIGRGILDGDIVVVRRQQTVDLHDVAAVLVGNEATLKYVRKERGWISLVPDNPTMKPIVVHPENDFQILGKVVSLFRVGV